MKTIALTGATSMLGLALINQCIKNGINVIAFCRHSSPNLKEIPESKNVIIVECDLSEMNDFDVSSLSADVFYHFGWSKTEHRDFNLCYEQVENIKYTLNAVYLAKRMSCRKFIGAGTQAEHGISSYSLNQDSPICPTTGYGIAKYAAGRLSKIECEKLGLEHIWVRILYVFGKNYNENSMLMTFIKNCKNNLSMNLSDCTQIWDYLYDEDAAYAFFLLGENGIAAKTYTLGSGIGRPLKEYLEIIRNKINGKYSPNYGAIPDTEVAVKYLVADISEITGDTGWQPKISFEEGIAAVIERLL